MSLLSRGPPIDAILVFGGALIFARMLSCTFLRFTCFGGVGWGWGGVGWGGVGWGCQRSLKLHTCCMLRNCVSVASAHVLDATPVMGWGGVKFLHIERKITSVVHSHPPSHYIRKHASG